MSEEKFVPYYSKIAGVLSEMIPVEWTELFMIYYDDAGVSSTGMYFRGKDGILHWFHDIPSEFCVDEEIYDSLESELRDICEEYKHEFIEETGDSWSCMSFHLTVDMDFDIEYYYDIESDVDVSDLIDRIFHKTYQIEPEGEFDKKRLYKYLAEQKFLKE